MIGGYIMLGLVLVFGLILIIVSRSKSKNDI